MTPRGRGSPITRLTTDNGTTMDASLPRDVRPATPGAIDILGRVASVTGAQASIELSTRGAGAEKPTVGKFVGMSSGTTLIVGMITEVGEQQPSGAQTFRKIARLDLLGEIRGDRFQRGVTEYPSIGDNATLLGEAELRLVYGGADNDHGHIGDLQQNPDIGVHIDIDSLVSRHFAVLGATGVGKSSGVAIILQKILDTRPNLRIFLVDPHNEY